MAEIDFKTKPNLSLYLPLLPRSV